MRCGMFLLLFGICPAASSCNGAKTSLSAESRSPNRNFDMQSDPSPKCVEALAAVAKSSAPALVTAGDRIQIGSTKVRLQARTEKEVKVDDPSGFLIGLAVDVFVDDVFQPLTYGVVGVGRDRDDALQNATREWAMYVGQALLGALSARIGEEPQKISNFRVYKGLGIREASGTHATPLSKEQYEQLLVGMDPFIRGMEQSPADLHSISLTIMVRNGTADGECRLDGHPSPELFRTVRSIAWSQNGSDYIFKQFFVLRRG